MLYLIILFQLLPVFQLLLVKAYALIKPLAQTRLIYYERKRPVRVFYPPAIVQHHAYSSGYANDMLISGVCCVYIVC